jgi:hypothetical protein
MNARTFRARLCDERGVRYALCALDEGRVSYVSLDYKGVNGAYPASKIVLYTLRNRTYVGRFDAGVPALYDGSTCVGRVDVRAFDRSTLRRLRRALV